MESEENDSRLENDESEDDLEISEAEGDGTCTTGLDNNGDGVVVLIVSDEIGEEHKSGIAEALTRDEYASWKEEVTLSNTRILTGAKQVVVDTTPLKCMSGKSPTAIARRWISHNSLRRIIFNRHVIVVCVITRHVLGAPCYDSVFGYDNCWVDVLSILFKAHRAAVLFTSIDTAGAAMMRRMRRFVRNHRFSTKNIIFSSKSSGSDDVARVVTRSVGMEFIGRASKRSCVQRFRQKLSDVRKSCFRCIRCIFSTRNEGGVGKWDAEGTPMLTIKPLPFAEVSFEQKRYTVWGPERVILFGRTGAGKSTLAQMLTTGKLDPGTSKFSCGSGVRGHTKDIQHGEGRGWYVVDTPGFGEPPKEGTIPTGKVERNVKRFVGMVEGTFAHYIFVFKKDRIDKLDEDLWKFFKILFRMDSAPNDEDLSYCSIVFSGADKNWIEQNKEYLERCFKGCRSFLPAEFPCTWMKGGSESATDLELKGEEEDIQRTSLKKLEEELARCERADRACIYGGSSTMNKVIERDRSTSDMRIERSMRIRMIAQGSEVIFKMDEFVTRLVGTLIVNDKVALAPLSLE